MDNNVTMVNDGATAVATDNNQALTEEQMEQMSEDELLTIFAEEMMKQKGLDSELDQDTYKTLLEDLKQRMEYQINRAIVAQLTDEDLAKIGDKLENNTATAEDLDKCDKDLLAFCIDNAWKHLLCPLFYIAYEHTDLIP